MAFLTINGSWAGLLKITQRGFTFIELMVVMVVITLLLTIAVPRYFDGLQRSKEAILREDLATMRDAIDHYHADKGNYPPTLEALVEQRYLRFIPEDPITGSKESWALVPLPDNSPGMYDIRSGSQEVAEDGTPYATW
jgi:general secretion pathway protein G